MTETSLRERKKVQRRDALVAATRALVLERGLDGVTVEDVCAQVGVSPRTFFNYFATKEDAVLGHTLDDLSTDADVQRVFVAGGPSGDLLQDAVLVLQDVLDDPRLSARDLDELMALVHREPRLLERHVFWIETQRSALEDLLVRREAVAPSGLDPAVVATYLMATFRAVAVTWVAGGHRGRPSDHVPRVVAQLRRLATPTHPSAGSSS
ncbi:TetR/AcrR family transcriptional regulator [Serinibacter arcticus]|uniref:TetR/AcrR family transcriptional regulator n=1 Tax=Serinibacter arcticus TaxID=1655435 RepID=UPI0011B27C36|nr:TetR/AcrR family transcriptional regulator [Serinibacter arcticus]